MALTESQIAAGQQVLVFVQGVIRQWRERRAELLRPGESVLLFDRVLPAVGEHLLSVCYGPQQQSSAAVRRHLDGATVLLDDYMASSSNPLELERYAGDFDVAGLRAKIVAILE